MQAKTPVAWFEIVVKDMAQAIAFYESVFQVKLARENSPEYVMAIFPYQDPYPSGALVQGKMFEAHTASAGTTIVYLATDAIDATLLRVTENGGSIVFPCQSIGENGFIAGFNDSEGNTIGLWSDKP